MNRWNAKPHEARNVRNTNPRAMIWLLLIVLTLSLTACGPGRDKSRKAAIDWSRGVEIARKVVGAIDIYVEGDGEIAHLVWPAEVGSRVRIRYMQLDAQTAPVLDQYLEMETAWPRNARLAEAQGDRLHFFWANRLGGEISWALWHGFIDTSTGELGDAEQISPVGIDVDTFAIAADGSQGVYVVWDERNAPGFDCVHINASGEIDDGPVTVDPEGTSPTVAIDGSGNLHFAWFDEADVTYAMLPSEDLQAVEGTMLTSVPLGVGDAVAGPDVGFSDGWVYVLWSTSSFSGMEPGTAKGWFAAFPENAPRLLVPEQLQLVPFEEQVYEPYEGAYNLTELAEPAVAPYGSDYVEDPATVSGQSSALVAAITMEQALRQDSFQQIAILVLEEGRLIGFQVATKTSSLSREPVIVSDASGSLYIAWREGAGRDRAYFATTAPAGREALDKTEGYEVFRTLTVASMEGFASLGVFPFAFFWLAPGLLILGAVEVFGRETDVNKPVPLALFIVSLLLYQLMKVIILPTIFTYVPFSAWFEVSEVLGSVLRVVVPLATLGIGLLISWWISWRRDNRAVFLFFFVTAGIDAILTLLIYGVTFFGAV
jgi:hypothetical protein